MYLRRPSLPTSGVKSERIPVFTGHFRTDPAAALSRPRPQPVSQAHPAGKCALRTDRTCLLRASTQITVPRVHPGSRPRGSPSPSTRGAAPGTEGPPDHALQGVGFCLTPCCVLRSQHAPRLQEAARTLFCLEPAIYLAQTILLQRERRVPVGG